MPKGKGKKGKDAISFAELDKMSPEDMSEKQLKKYVIYLQEELEKERRERTYFQLDVDKLNSFLEMCSGDLEETKAKLCLKDIERKEADKHHRTEIGKYETKVKHAEFEQHSAVSEVKMEVSASASLIKKQQTESELELQRIIQNMLEDQRRDKVMKETSVKEVILKHQLELLELNKDYDKRIREMKDQYCKKYQMKINADEKKHWELVKKHEDQFRSNADHLIQKHKATLRAVSDKLSTLQTDAMKQEKALEKKVAELQKLLTQVDKDVSAAQQENESLCSSVEKSEFKLTDLDRRMRDYNQHRGDIVKKKACMKVITDELRDVTVKHELLQHELEEHEKECEEMQRKHRQATWNLQQQGALKEQGLQRKLALLTQTG
ncbi:dynein regulatory complex subunit 4-like [Solea senegalensis]|uniref:Dynein regulatory complex subunit 4 n=1 Tax=Solea senegalensis TaxID=28829 RepID=A0AAV6SLA5_SOLSE|nr:dynein regulatory complex subunit 4-like [Solea senegalensis]KAG7518241.1 dynein regulatory complex subunit 4-like [Solea senegalensis]